MMSYWLHYFDIIYAWIDSVQTAQSQCHCARPRSAYEVFGIENRTFSFLLRFLKLHVIRKMKTRGQLLSQKCDIICA